MFGISAALVTPFDADGSVDTARLRGHIAAVLADGCASVTLFGTTGEGASVARDARLGCLRAMIDAGCDPTQTILTLHGAAADDVADQAAQAVAMGVTRFLIPPPCYFADPGDAGLAEWFTRVFARLDGTGARFILYHIPQVIGVGLSISLVARLKSALPEQVIGVKDSSGSFDNTAALLRLADLQILVGDERQLAACARLGAAGSISGIANLFGARLGRVLASGQDDAAINTLVDTVLQYPVTPAIKSLVALRHGSDEWLRTLPPLVPTSATGRAVLARTMAAT
jgi:4-hydroxy-tetrahydrodipicolinate synthase